MHTFDGKHGSIAPRFAPFLVELLGGEVGVDEVAGREAQRLEVGREERVLRVLVEDARDPDPQVLAVADLLGARSFAACFRAMIAPATLTFPAALLTKLATRSLRLNRLQEAVDRLLVLGQLRAGGRTFRGARGRVRRLRDRRPPARGFWRLPHVLGRDGRGQVREVLLRLSRARS